MSLDAEKSPERMPGDSREVGFNFLAAGLSAGQPFLRKQPQGRGAPGVGCLAIRGGTVSGAARKGCLAIRGRAPGTGTSRDVSGEEIFAYSITRPTCHRSCALAGNLL